MGGKNLNKNIKKWKKLFQYYFFFVLIFTYKKIIFVLKFEIVVSFLFCLDVWKGYNDWVMIK